MVFIRDNFTNFSFLIEYALNLTIFFFFSLFLLFFLALPFLHFPLYIRQSFQAQNDKIRIISSFSDVDYEEQECIYEEVEGEMSQEFLEDSNINLKEAEVKEVRTLLKTDKYYNQQIQPKYKNSKKAPSQSQETEFSAAFNYDLKFETPAFSRCPQKYDTIDRRRKKTPLYSHFEDSERRQYDDKSATKTNFRSTYPNTGNCDFCHIEKKEQNYTVLHPYKNGFVVKSGKWATNLENHDFGLPGCFKNYEKSSDLNQHITNFTPLDILEDSTSSTSDELLGSPVSDKQEYLLSPTCHPSNVHHIGGFPEEYYRANPAFPSQRMNYDTDTLGDLSGCPTEEMTPSCVEEPKEDYVDTMDELQCLVETVSEYLAEKEEEINKFGSLSETKKTLKHNSTVNNAEKKMPEDQIPSSNVVKNDRDKAISFPELNGVKYAVGSLFSSLSEKVGSGTKHLTTSVEKLVHLVPEKTETLNQTGASNSPSRPRARSVSEKDLSIQPPSLISSQTVDNKDFCKVGKTSENEDEDSTTGNLNSQDPTETIGRDSAPQSQSSVIKSVFSMLNPLKIFSEKDETKNDDDQSKPTKKENFVACDLGSNQREDTLGNDSSIITLNRSDGETPHHQMPLSEDLLSSNSAFEPSNSALSASKKDDVSNILEREPCTDLSVLPEQPKIFVKDTSEHPCVAGSKTANKEASSEPLEGKKITGDDFLEPLRKSFSQFLLTSPETCSKETLSDSMKIHQLEEDGWERDPKKDGCSFSFSGKLHIPFLKVLSHSEKQQDLKEKGSMFPLFKFSFTDSHKTVNDQSFHGSAVTTDEEVQRNCHANAKLSSIKSNSVPDIHSNLRKFGDIKTSNENDQINTSEDATLTEIKCDSTPNINSNLGKFGSVEELNSSDDTAVENCERDTLNIPGDMSKEHIPSDSSEENKALTQVTSLSVPDSSLAFSSTISKPTSVNEMSDDKLVDKASEKRTQGGLFSSLFNRFSSLENLSNQQELNVKKDDSSHRSNTPSLFSGIFNLISGSSMTDSKPDEAKSMSLSDLNGLNGTKRLSSDEIPVTSCVTSENQRNCEKQETSGFVKRCVTLPKEDIPLSDAGVDDHCPPTWKNEQSEKNCPSSASSVLHCSPVAQQDLSEKSLHTRQIPHHVLEAKLHENSNKLTSPILNTNILSHSNHYWSFEDMDSSFSYDWDSDIKDCSKNSRKIQPVYYLLNQNTFPSTDVFLWPDSEKTAINFCQRDQNANISEGRTNPNSVIWCDLPYESFNQLAFNEDYLLRGDMWAANSLYGNSCYFPINETKNSLEELPIDLSCSSGYEKSICPIVDLDSSRMNENFIFSSVGYEYQEWLSCFENGMWWPSEDGDYGYFMFHDDQYIYFFLTDSTGQYAYLFIPDFSYEDYLNCDLQNVTNDLSSIILDDCTVSAYSFKVFDKEDELLRYVEEEPNDDPLDLSVVLPRSGGPMYLNLGTFSQVLESNYDQSNQPLDFSGYNRQKSEGNFVTFKERLCGSEDPDCMLDLRNQPQTIGNHVLNKNEIIKGDKRQPLSKDSSVNLSSFHWIQSSSEEASSSEDKTNTFPENKTNIPQQREEMSSLNKVTSLFSALGASIGNTLNFDKSETLKSSATQKRDQQSNLAEITNDSLQLLISSKQLESNSQNEEESLLKKDSERQIVQQLEFTKNMKKESPLNKSMHVKKQSLLKPVFQVSQATPQDHSDIEDDKMITADSVSVSRVSQFSRDEHKNYEPPQDQSSKESERTLFKSALKLFGREENPSVSATANEKQAPGFLNLFKTQVNKEGSPSLEKNNDKNRKISSQEKNESPGVSNFWGTLGDFFKSSVSPIQTTENVAVSSVTNKEEVKSSPNATHLARQDVGNFPAAPVYSKGKVRVRGLNKQTTIDDSELKEPAIKEIKGDHLTEEEVPSRDHLTYKSPNSSFSTGFKDSSKDSSVETSGMSVVTEVPRSDKISLDIPSRRNSNEQDHFSDKDHSFSTATTSPSQPELPTRKSIFSFLTGSEKSENRASAALPRTKSQVEGLFTLPSFFPTANSGSKDASPKSSFSFFSLSFLDEKQQSPGKKQSLSTTAPVTSQPCKRPSVFVDMSGTITEEGSNGDGDSMVQEVVHEQQMAPCVSISNTTEIISLADELNVEENDPGKLGSNNGPGTSSDFQINQSQKDIVPHSPGFQAQTETRLIGPETLEVSTYEEAFVQEASVSDSLASSFSHDRHLVEKLNNLDTCTNSHQNERFTSDPLNLPLEKAPDEVLTKILEPTSSSVEPGGTWHFQSQGADKEEDKSVLDSSVEMLSGFVTKVKSFSGSLIEPPKTFSGLFSSPKPPKKNSFFSLSSGTSSQPLKGELFGIFKSPKPETCKQESSVPATALLQNGSPRDTVGSVPPENFCEEVTLRAVNSESMVSDCGMTVVSAESDLETLTDDPKLTTETENNNIPDNIPEPHHSETIEGASSVSGDDTGQGVLSLSDEGDMGMLQATDTEASLEAEHIPLPIQLHPDPTWIAKELPPPVQPPLPLEPEADMQSISTNQDFLELQAASSLETALFSEASVSQSATMETQGYISHPPLEEPVLCAKEHLEILDAQKDSTAVPQEAEQPGPHFEIPNVTSWPKLHFPSAAADYGKSLSSFFSSPSSSGSRAAETGLMSSFKKLSTLFEGGSEGKGSSVVASDSKLRFGKKLDLSFPWPKENKGDSEQMPAESSSPALVISSDQDLKSGETDKTLESSQMSGASAEPAKVLTQPSGTSEQLEARPSICTQDLSRPGEVENQEIPASGEDRDTKDICPSESHEEEHCTVSELLQPETHEEEAEPASTGSVSNVQQPVTLLDIKEPKTSKRPVLN
ncbi:uncharacterized protein LOC129556782 [Moschus berezovskii]|uniref:uncharacterized protein LOC129556782 n=1 Tax=Moschus berezovskii TaxID=68408 RepID=UPI002444AC6F|nr:uncharacterized protein LOC129556782 [Moschus berezovskii]